VGVLTRVLRTRRGHLGPSEKGGERNSIIDTGKHWRGKQRGKGELGKREGEESCNGGGTSIKKRMV